MRPNKTRKDQKEARDLHQSWRDNREVKRDVHVRGGKRNIVREALEEREEEIEDAKAQA